MSVQEEVTPAFASKTSTDLPEDLAILALLSLAPKSINELSSETKVPMEKCHRLVEWLMDIGLIRAEHESDAYGHETIRFVRFSSVIFAFPEQKT